MSAQAIIVALLRGIHVTAALSLFGTLVCLIFVLPSASEQTAIQAGYLRIKLLRLARVSAACALIFGMAWLAVESAAIAGADTITRTLRVLPIVAFRTQFGQSLLLRCCLLVAIIPLVRASRAGMIVASLLAGLALAIQSLLGHAGAIGGSVGLQLMVSEALHLLAAGAWLGGLLPLFIAIQTLPPLAAANACRNFTPVGLAAVLVLAGTAIVQVVELIGGLPGLFGTTYGHVALIKVAVFGALLTIAVVNRLVLTDRLEDPGHAAPRRAMRISIALEAVLGVAVIITASLLGSQTPGTHEQPIWPFAWRLSTAAWSDPASSTELIAASVAMGSAVVLAALGITGCTRRCPFLGAAAIVVLLAAPHLGSLFVAAYPTSFFTSPTEFAATGIVHGAKLFTTNCAVCHGIQGRGDGTASLALPVRPADLTAEHFWSHTDGDVYWYVSQGFVAQDGRVAMPAFANTLSSEARWHLVDYLHASGARATMTPDGNFVRPLQVPQFDAVCKDGRAIDLDDLRGRMLRIVAIGKNEPLAPISRTAADAVTTIVLVRHPAAEPDGAFCVASEPEAWAAFAIILGVSQEALAGIQILVDQNAWLRAVWRPGDPGDWNDPQFLAERIKDIVSHPITSGSVTGHIHPR